jgi:hypothetical protein
MLEELLVKEGGQRYIGRVYADLERPPMNSQPLRWCFSHRGHFVAEFPAIPTDTPEEVKSSLLRVLAGHCGEVVAHPHPTPPIRDSAGPAARR